MPLPFGFLLYINCVVQTESVETFSTKILNHIRCNFALHNWGLYYFIFHYLIPKTPVSILF